MHVSPEGRRLIEAFEGCQKPIRARAGYFTTYYDPVGVLTIGYGHTNLGGIPPHIQPGVVWSQAECDRALASDLAHVEGDVQRIMKGIGLTQGQFDALCSFEFNTGDLAKSSIDDKIRAGRTEAALATLLLYTHAAGKELPGLVRRRKAEKLLFEGNTDAAIRLAGGHAVLGDTVARASKPAH